MRRILLLSLCLKGAGAALELILQVMLTRMIGMDGYGHYTAWINCADLIFWCLFSGIVKCNIFYLSSGGCSIRSFRNRYYAWYIIPIVLAAAAIGTVLFGITFLPVPLIAAAELLMSDSSSALLAQGSYPVSLSGEYVAGRMILAAGIFVMSSAGALTLRNLLWLYFFQYMAVFLCFSFFTGKDREKRDISEEISLGKWAGFQRADIMQAMIGQVPVLLQFFFAGAFETGVLGIIALVRKVVNFISGPAAKVYLPEFSRKYKEGDRESLPVIFASIMRIQMLFVGPMAVLLVGYPELLLSVFSKDLLPYSSLFAGCSGVFLFAASLGPCGGVLQMTENEKTDNRCRETAVILMCLVYAVFHRRKMFAVFGICIQTLTEAAGKFVMLCRIWGRLPEPFFKYISRWAAPGILILAARVFRLQYSWATMIGMCGAAFLLQLAEEQRLRIRGRKEEKGRREL